MTGLFSASTVLHSKSDNWIERPPRLSGVGVRDGNALYVAFPNVSTSEGDGKELNKLITTSVPMISQVPPWQPQDKMPLKVLLGLGPDRAVFILPPPKGSWRLHYQLLGHMKNKAGVGPNMFPGSQRVFS